MNSEARFPLSAEWERIQDAINDPQKFLGIGELHPQPDLVAFPLKIEWEATQARDLARGQAAYPAPVRTSRNSEVADLPSAVAKLAEFAREELWEVCAQSSLGSFPHGSTGRPTALKDTVALRFGGHPMTRRQAYAVYESPVSKPAWKPRSIMIWGPDLAPYAHCSMADLRLYLAEKIHLPEGHLNRWVRGLERERRAAEAFVKRRNTVRAQIRKVADDGRFRAAQTETRQDFMILDAEWRAKVADLQDGVFSSEEVAQMIDPSRRRGTFREGMS